MTWVRIDDGAPLHPKLLDAGPEAAWLWVAGLAHANRAVTDGVLRRAHLGALYPHEQWPPARLRALAQRLVEVGLWVETSDGWLIKGYAEYQEEALRESVEARRDGARERKRIQREREKARASPRSHAVTGRDTERDIPCDTERDIARDGSRDMSQLEPVGSSVTEPRGPEGDVTAPRPVPARPGPSVSSLRSDVTRARTSGGEPPRLEHSAARRFDERARKPAVVELEARQAALAALRANGVPCGPESQARRIVERSCASAHARIADGVSALAAWALTHPDPHLALERAVAAFAVDEWARANGHPLGALVNDPERYLAAARRSPSTKKRLGMMPVAPDSERPSREQVEAQLAAMEAEVAHGLS